MIADLTLLLGPGRAHILTTFLAWTTGYAVLSGVAAAMLVPVIESLASGDHQALGPHLLTLAIVTLIACVVQYFQTLRASAAALETLASMHKRLGDHLVGLPMGWFDQDRTGRLTRVATDGTMMITGIFAHLLAPLVVGVVAPATVTVAMFWHDWRLGLATALCIPVLAAGFRFAGWSLTRGEALDHAAAVEAGTRVIEFGRHQRVLRAFGRGVHGYQPLDDAIEQQRRTRRRSLGYGVAGLSVGGLVVQLAVTVLVLTGVWLALDGGLHPAVAVALIALAFRFAGPLADVSEYAGAIRIAAGDLRRLTDVLRERGLPEPAVSAPITRPGLIELDGVTFGYSPGAPVLREVSLTVQPGSLTALIGTSGSGKTTVIRLIARFWETQGGAVRVGGVDVRDMSTEDLMHQITLVFQDVYLFDDTLEANIRLGRPEATDAELREATRLAGVDEIVTRLPDGWHTRVGEGGAALSGGERQRVSIARALLKKAPIVLLDEATAALDPANERFLQRSIRQLAEHSTVLVITHRLSTVTEADQIVVLDRGSVAETGTHRQLIAADGRYARLWEARTGGQGWRLPSLSDR